VTEVEVPSELLENLDLAFHHEDGGPGFYGIPPEPKSVQESAAYINRRPGFWFACREPERPHEAFATFYHDCCRACTIAAEAAGFKAVAMMAWRLETFGEAEE
jgi:hypothetical protein